MRKGLAQASVSRRVGVGGVSGTLVRSKAWIGLWDNSKVIP